MIDFEKFKNYLDSEEGQQAMDRMSEKWAKEDDLNMEIDLSSQYDYRLSEMCKIEHYMVLYKEAED